MAEPLKGSCLKSMITVVPGLPLLFRPSGWKWQHDILRAFGLILDSGFRQKDMTNFIVNTIILVIPGL
jgi:hypothetical protein